jgi:hypothetical protein
LALITLSGAAAQVPDEFRRVTEAMSRGNATERDRAFVLLANMALGATESMPFAGTLNPAATGLRARFGRGIGQAIEETIQEGGQTGGQNLTRRFTYDPSQDPFEGLGESMVVAVMSGLGAGTLFSGSGRGVAAVVPAPHMDRAEEVARLERIKARVQANIAQSDLVGARAYPISPDGVRVSEPVTVLEIVGPATSRYARVQNADGSVSMWPAGQLERTEPQEGAIREARARTGTRTETAPAPAAPPTFGFDLPVMAPAPAAPAAPRVQEPAQAPVTAPEAERPPAPTPAAPEGISAAPALADAEQQLRQAVERILQQRPDEAVAANVRGSWATFTAGAR